MPIRNLAGGWAVSLALAAVVGAAFVQAQGQPKPDTPQAKDARPDGTLRGAAEARKLYVGACANQASLKDKNGAAVLARHFNLLVAENHMKWSIIHPARDEYAFDFADELVAFAEKNKMKVKGHALVWHGSTPKYLNDLTADELRAALKDHIKTVMTRYKGKVASWDVVNEALDDGDGLRGTLWREKLGQGYIAEAFRISHEVDPDAVLIYNDYDCEGAGGKSDRQYALLKQLLKDEVPVHQVGLQMHLHKDRLPKVEDIVANIRRLAELGLTVNISEMDMVASTFQGELPAKLEAQAKIFGDIIRACAKEKGFVGVTFWGYSDKYSWRNRPDDKAYPLLFDEQMKPKPAFFAVRKALE
jgi:endo-1,4-beta-xylanase